jgi:histone deacetylase 1/2
VHHFLGVEISTIADGLHLSQSHYALTILDRSSMLHCKPMSMPLEAKFKIDANTSSIVDPSQFRRIVSALQYLTLT